MSDTPRTDAAIDESVRGWSYQPLFDESRKIERELSDLRAKLAAAEKDMKPLKTIMSLDGKNLLARFYDYDYFYKVTAAIEKERGNV